MNTVVFLLWSAMTVSGMVVMGIAIALWLPDVIRGEDDDANEPSPVDKRAAPFMLLTALVLAGVRLSRSQPLSFSDTVFAAAFIGFALSAGWYLLARRSPQGHSSKQIKRASAAVAVTFGTLSAFAS